MVLNVNRDKSAENGAYIWLLAEKMFGFGNSSARQPLYSRQIIAKYFHRR